jgi:hypothetical protein
MSNGMIIRVVDVPMGVSAEEAERLLDAVDNESFYPATIVQGEISGTPGVAHRTFHKRGARREDA